MNPDELRVTIDDIRATGFCVNGLRGWFDSHGLDLREFLEEGLPVKLAYELNDAYAIAAAKSCLRRHGVSDGVK